MPFELASDWLSVPLAATAMAAAGAGVAAGWLLSRPWRACRHGHEDREDEVRDLRKTVSLLQNENKSLAIFLLTLPDLARQLNSNIEKRKIPSLLLSFIAQLFEAEQVLIFLTAHDGKHLILAGGKGFPEKLMGHQTIPFGKGRVGWVAEHQITMDENDFTQKARSLRGALETYGPRGFRTELCAPMVAQDKTLGAISLGGLLRRPKNEKNMLKMVADLGSISIQNTLLFTMIQNSANSDGLTGLANRRHFQARLAEELLKAEKDQRPLSVFIFDIDHFKSYNDTNGHVAGDEALRMTGRLITEAVRQDDLAARYGGEEFIVMFPNTDKQGAELAAEKLRRVIEAHPYRNEESQPTGRVTISGGIATFPYDAHNTADLIRFADQALYQAKRDGRNRVCVHLTRYLSEDTADALGPGSQSVEQMRGGS